MKYLIKYNEGINMKNIKTYGRNYSDKITKEYIEDVEYLIKFAFSEIGDNHNIVFDKFRRYEDENDKEFILGRIVLQIPEIKKLKNNKNGTDIEFYKNWSNELFKKVTDIQEFFLDIEICIKRIKDKYPNLIYDITNNCKSVFSADAIHIEFIIK